MRRVGQCHHGNLRNALIDAARERLDAGAHEAISLRDLALQQGTTPGAPYRHFKSRNELLRVLILEGVVEMTERYAAAAARAGSPRTRLKAACRSYIAFSTERPQLFRQMFQPDMLTKSVVASQGQKAATIFRSLVANVLPSSSLLRINAAALSCWCAIHGFATLRAIGGLELGFNANQTEESILETLLSQSLPSSTSKPR